MIGLCTFVKNEAHCIKHMVGSVAPYISEWVVLDTGSTDGTQKLCREMGARVYETGFIDFGKARTLAAHLCRKPWVLMLDADETLTGANRLKDIIKTYRSFAYGIPRRRWLDLKMTQQTEMEAYPDLQVRLFANDPAFRWCRELHEYFDGAPVEDLEEAEFGVRINHFQDVFKDNKANQIRRELYEKLAKKAGVTVDGGFEVT